MTNFDNYLKALDYLDVYDNGIVYRKERVWNNNGGIQVQPRKICPQTIDGSGYSNVSLCIDGFNFSPKVHVLVMIKYKGLPEKEDMQVDHIDGNKQNNNLNNLEWVSASKNCKRAYDIGLHKTSDYERECKRNRMIEKNPMKNPEVAKKISEWHKGNKLSEETKKKISESGKGRIVSNETKAKIGKPVYAYKDNELILSFITAREADRNGYSRTAIKKSIENNIEYKGYYWSHDLH